MRLSAPVFHSFVPLDSEHALAHFVENLKRGKGTIGNDEFTEHGNQTKKKLNLVYRTMPNCEKKVKAILKRRILGQKAKKTEPRIAPTKKGRKIGPAPEFTPKTSKIRTQLRRPRPFFSPAKLSFKPRPRRTRG